MTLTSFRDLLMYIGMSLTLFTTLSVAALMCSAARGRVGSGCAR